MKFPTLAISLLIVSQTFASPSAKIEESPAIIPQPASIELTTGKPGYSLAQGLSVNGNFIGIARIAFDNSGIDIKPGSPGNITFKKDASLPEEGYKLVVTPNSIEIAAATPKGAFYAFQTLAQSIVQDADGKPAIPAMTVNDQPRFAWRGIMIDSGRHALPVNDIKKIIGLMARYKFNTLHWHLTEDQGWRIEIKKYPKLTEIGSIRAQSPNIGERGHDGTPYQGYYSQEQIKDIVKYAKERSITVIPEIEIPGHAAAAIAAYPEYGNKDIRSYDPKVIDSWGIFRYTFNPSDKTLAFLGDVIAEVCELFPDSPYIHTGGDEAPKNQWKDSPFAQQFMKEKGLKDEHELQSYMVREAEKIVNKHGKRLIGWDEINEGGLSKTATMMVWRDWKWADYAISQGNDVVMSPRTHLYFDYGQGSTPDEPGFKNARNNISLSKVYNLDPVPAGLTPEKAKHVLGVQANHWSEFIYNLAKWEYMSFPRSIALSEVAWTPLEQKNEENFNNRLKKHLPFLDKLKVNYRNPENGNPAQPDAPIKLDTNMP